MSGSAPRRRLRVAAAIVWRGDEVLMTRRPPRGPFGLRWEFPGGKLEPGESPEQASVRELEEELAVRAVARDVLSIETHDDSGFSVELAFVRCELETQELRPGAEVHEVRWIRPADVDPAEVLDADRAFLARLAGNEIR
jgi:8-oxo-dGTP diphosphatase